MPPSCILSLQVALVEDPTLTFISCPPLNPDTLHILSSTPLIHSCPKILEELLPCQDHIQEGALSQADYTWLLMAAPLFTMDNEKQDMLLCLIPLALRHTLSLWIQLPRRLN
jgi:hypothetical protein